MKFYTALPRFIFVMLIVLGVLVLVAVVASLVFFVLFGHA